MLSRVMGFVRDAIVARYFGAGAAMDAFVVAFRLPNLLRRIFAEGAFSQAFVPMLADYKQNKSDEETRLFVQHVAGMLTFCAVYYHGNWRVCRASCDLGDGKRFRARWHAV